jgi:hypothetical protein
MKCKKSKLLMLALALTSVLMTAVIVNAKPLYGVMALDFTGPANPVWTGTISGDIGGKMYFYNTGGRDVGQAHFFEETWLITDQDDVMLLTGTDTGVVSWASLKYRMNGVVEDAAPGYEYLIGHNVHMSGTITLDGAGVPETAPGVFRVN